MRDPVLLRLEDAPARGIGGKGEALRRLQRHGLPVPETWVVPVEGFVRFMEEHHLSPDLPDLPARIRSLPLRLDALPALPPLLAVRSSALDEDGRHSSAAGQYETVLNVSPADLSAAILRCWASFYSPRALAYRKRTGPPGMAVLVQPMVDARVAGVLFTVNPLTGSWREMTIEAVWGLGEGLVSGQVVPDRYRVRRPRATPSPASLRLRLVSLDVIEESVAPQHSQLIVRKEAKKETPVQAPFSRKLPRPDLLNLCRLGLRTEAEMDGPQDIEWVQDRGGRFLIVQARPITTTRKLPRGGATLWTRRFIGERWPGGASPLGWSIIAPILEYFISYPETSRRYLGGDPPLRLVEGHPYINATVFRHLAFKLPGRPPPRFMLDFFPPDEEEAWLRRAAAPPDLQVYGSIFQTTFAEKRWQRFRWNPFANHQAWQVFLRDLDHRLMLFSAAPEEKALDLGTALIRDYIKIHITSLLFANLYYEVVSPFVPPDDKDLLFSDPRGTVTAWVNRDLWLLAQNPSMIDLFLQQHGHRSDASWEIFSRRWAEDPAGVLKLASLLRDQPDPTRELSERAERTEAALARLSPTLQRAVRLAQAYLRLREEQRYHFDRILAPLKEKLGRLGARWLERPEDVRFLHASELDGHLGAAELRRTVARRSAETVAADPPEFLHGDEAVPPPRHYGGRIQGLGISPGMVRGRTRVLRSLDEAEHLRTGEILVTRSTDPSWTPLFSRAGGLILEMGSMLSHGAVVAREYRLPGVVNIMGALDALPTGTDVTVDGAAGVVWVHS